MPAQFNCYSKVSEVAQPATIITETPDKKYIVFKREYPIYNSDNIETAIRIGTNTSIYTVTISANNNDNIATLQAFFVFNEYAGVPYGDENVLVVNYTTVNKIDVSNLTLKIGNYTTALNSNLSTGEYANQVGYREYFKTVTKLFNEFIFYFPLPTVTYTNAFNSLPQPSTAPLPA
jgi:hypothetical protein